MAYNVNYDMGNIKVEALPTSISVTCTKAYYANTPASYKVQVYGGSSLTTLVAEKIENDRVFYFGPTDGIVKNTKYKVTARAFQNTNGGGDNGNSVSGTVTTPIPGGGSHPKATKKVTTTFTSSKTVSPSFGANNASSGVTNNHLNDLNNTFGSKDTGSKTKKKISNAAAAEKPASEVSSGVENSSFEYNKGYSIKSVGNNSIQRGTLVLDSKDKKINKATIATRKTNISESATYYAFGTGLFFGSDLDKVNSSGGIGVFTDSSGMNGYFIKLESTDVVGSEKKQVRLLKSVSGNIRRIDAKAGVKELALVYGATLYRVDVFIKTSATQNEIFISVNGNVLTHIDKDVANTDNPFDKKISPTDYVSLFCNLGQAHFDYVYANVITEKDYNDKVNVIKYRGQTGDATLNNLFGERIVSNFEKQEVPGGFLEEFGPTAREIVRTNVKFENRPGFPLKVSTGINPYVQVLGSKMNSFGADVYVLNNAGTFMPLAGGPHTYSIWGNYVSEPGVQEYSENLYSANTYTSPDPVTFESKWIQNESDAKSLATFIKTQWSKQQSAIQLEVFGNPLVSVGEIITVNYPKNNLTGTEKFLVTSVNLGFGEEASTRITARSIYS